MSLEFLIQSRVNRIATAVLVALFLGILIGTIYDTTGASMLRSGDFPGFFVQGEIIRRGLGEALYNFGLQRFIQNEVWPTLNGSYNPAAYPPFTALLLYPLSLLDHQPAQFLFTAIMLWLYYHCIRIVASMNRTLADKKYPLFAGLLLFAPLFCSIFGSQVTMVCAVLFLMTIRLLVSDHTQHHLYAGLLLGLTFFKPQYGSLFLLGSLCILPSIHMFLGCLAVLGGFWIVTAFFFSINWVGWWLEAIAPFDRINLIVNIHEAISARGIMTALGYSYETGWIVTLVATALLLGSLLFLARKKTDRKLLFALLLSALPLVAPQTLFYDLPLALFGYLSIVDGDSPNDRKKVAAICIVGGLLFVMRTADIFAVFAPLAVIIPGIVFYEIFSKNGTKQVK